MRQPWLSSAVLAVLVLKCPPPIWIHSDISVGLWSFETMQQSSENGLDLDEDCIVHSCICGCCYACVLNLHELKITAGILSWLKILTPPLPLPLPSKETRGAPAVSSGA